MWQDFLRLNNILLLCIDHIIYIHSSVNGCLNCFYLLTVVNNAAINMSVKMSCQGPACISFGCKPWCGIGGAYGDSVLSFLRNLHLFSIAPAPFYIHINSAPLSPHPHCNTYFRGFCFFAILIGMKWYLTIVWFSLPWLLVILTIFSCTIDHMYIVFGEMPV